MLENILNNFCSRHLDFLKYFRFLNLKMKIYQAIKLDVPFCLIETDESEI